MRKKEGIKRVAIIGSQGVPPKYGGFETLVDNIISHRSDNVEYTIFCSSPDMDTTLTNYKGCRLKYVNIRAHGVMSVPYDCISMIKALRGYDAILMLGVSGGIFLPFFKMISRAKVIVNVDGLEHKREKWDALARKYLKHALGLCLRWADEIVSDNEGIRKFIKENYNRKAHLIAYGGNHALRNLDEKRQKALLDFYNLESGKYDLSVCRIEPENNVHLTLKAYEDTGVPIAFIGNWNHSDYSRALYNKYKSIEGFHLINSIYDLDVLYALRNNSRRYVHGHKSGGTNPSLVEAMFFDKPILAYDVIYNRETTQNKASYFLDVKDLKDLIIKDLPSHNDTLEVARKDYVWEKIACQYENLF